MIWKWMGAALVITGCAAAGFSAASSHRRTEAGLKQLLEALSYMECELSFRLTPLPDLCRLAGAEQKNAVGQALLELARELDSRVSPDVEICLQGILSGMELPNGVQEAFRLLGTGLGRFDLDGQLRGLKQVQDYCSRELEVMSRNREERLRSYQTLGLCAGAAIAILFV